MVALLGVSFEVRDNFKTSGQNSEWSPVTLAANNGRDRAVYIDQKVVNATQHVATAIFGATSLTTSAAPVIVGLILGAVFSQHAEATNTLVDKAFRALDGQKKAGAILSALVITWLTPTLTGLYAGERLANAVINSYGDTIKGAVGLSS